MSLLISDNVRQEITKLVPSSVISDISCFIFFDSHPRELNQIDIVVCTKFGEVKEYFQRDLVLSLHLDIPTPTEIAIVRNDNADPFYLVFGGNQLFILSRGEKLQTKKRIRNVHRYEMEDTMCSGRVSLKVHLNDDAVPLIFDDNFEIVEVMCNEGIADDPSPLLTELMRKLTEAKYSVKRNEKMYDKFVNFRLLAMFSKYQKININADNAFCNDLKEIASALKIDTLAPWVKICNNQIVIVFNITNQDEEVLEEVQVLLHGTTRPAISYTTKLFEKTISSPFYRQKKAHNVKLNNTVAVTVVVNLNQLKCNVLSRITFDAVIMFKKKHKEFLLPLERVIISSLDTLKEDFDVLHNKNIDDPNTILAILATTEKTDLHLRHLKTDGENEVIIQNICDYLNMEQVPNTNNVFIHRKAPYHTLHGVMVLVQDAETLRSDYNISVYTRSQSQVLAFTHFIHDAVPAKIIITTANLKIEAISDELSEYNEDISITEPSPNYTEYAVSMLNRTSTLLKYLDKMMIKMNSNKNPSIQNKIGKEIHLFADGVDSYVEFRNKMLSEADKGVKELLICDTISDDCEAMIID